MLSQDIIGDAAWALACVAVINAVVRLALGVLAARVARSVLRASAHSPPAHRLAVLRAFLNGLRPPRG